MAKKVIMPKLGLTMISGTILKWYKKEGELVEKDEPLFEIESDKSTVEVEAPESGILRAVFAQEGDVVPVTDTVAVIAEKDEDITEFIDSQAIDAEVDPKAATSTETAKKNGITPLPEDIGQTTKKIRISPRAKKLAEKVRIDSSNIIGTGPGGRIVESDVKNYLEEQSKINTSYMADNFVAPKEEAVQTVAVNKIQEAGVTIAPVAIAGQSRTAPYKGIRKVIGDRLAQSMFTAPHAYLSVAVDMSKAKGVRDYVKGATGIAVSMNDVIVHAVARALKNHPALNSSLLNNEVVYHDQVHIGVAVAADNGLVVPVVRNAHHLSLREIAQETRRLIDKAQKGELVPDEYSGGTFTISNLGMTKINIFTAIINPPEAAILGVGGIARTPVVLEDSDEIVIKPLMNITVSIDHRIVDGYEAAQFLQTVKRNLEEPYLLL